MSKAIYIATSEAESGKSMIALGLMSMLLGKTKKVAYFRPIIANYPDNVMDNY
jgi:phosphate acetyltransferase